MDKRTRLTFPRRNLGFSFLNGGPAATFFGMIFVMAVTILQVLSIAEIASAQPIAGAQYVGHLWKLCRSRRLTHFSTTALDLAMGSRES